MTQSICLPFRTVDKPESIAFNEAVRILTLSGSLRLASSNVKLLRAIKDFCPVGVEAEAFEGLAGLPAFNPDLDGESPPEPVRQWRASLARADAVVISSPEYVHGVPGALKNALDWIVSSGEISSKRVGLINASAGSGEFAEAQLKETLTVMEARVLFSISLPGPLVRRGFDESGKPVEAEIITALTACVDTLIASCLM